MGVQSIDALDMLNETFPTIIKYWYGKRTTSTSFQNFLVSLVVIF